MLSTENTRRSRKFLSSFCVLTGAYNQQPLKMSVEFPHSAEEERRARHSGMLNPNLKKLAVLLEGHGITDFTLERLRICDGSLPDEFVDTFINFLDDANEASAERAKMLTKAQDSLHKAMDEHEKAQARASRTLKELAMLQGKGDAMYEQRRKDLQMEGEQVREMNRRELDLNRQVQREELKLKLKAVELERLGNLKVK
jgi:hypothetical protein